MNKFSLLVEKGLDFERTVYAGHIDQRFGPSTYSQNGEDLIIANIFDKAGIQTPGYIDIGAHHPTRISNTALLYSRGSNGVNVEANIDLMSDFHKQRPRDINLLAAMGPTHEKRILYRFDHYSGRNTFSREKAEEYVRDYGATIMDHVEIDTITIKDVIDAYFGGLYPAFLNIDCEGMDFEILSAADFTYSAPLVICVETQHAFEKTKMRNLLAKWHYRLFMSTGDNGIYVREPLLNEILTR